MFGNIVRMPISDLDIPKSSKNIGMYGARSPYAVNCTKYKSLKRNNDPCVIRSQSSSNSGEDVATKLSILEVKYPPLE